MNAPPLACPTCGQFLGLSWTTTLLLTEADLAWGSDMLELCDSDGDEAWRVDCPAGHVVLEPGEDNDPAVFDDSDRARLREALSAAPAGGAR